MADPHSFVRQQADFNPTDNLRPAAASTGVNFVPTPTNTGFDDAMKSLASLEPSITGFTDKLAAKEQDQDTKAGREAALKEALEYGDAVKQGKIAPNASPWFMKGYKSQYGEVVGQQWALEAKTAWTNSDAKNSDDPKAANDFVTKFINDKLATGPGSDPDVRAGLLPHLANMRSTVINAQAEWSSKQVMEKAQENIGTLIGNDVDAYVKSGGKMKLDDLLASIKQHDSAGRLMGIDNDSLNKAVVQAVTNKAREMDSTSLLKVLDAYPTVGKNPKYMADIRNANDAIVSHAATQANLAWTQEQRAVTRASRMAKLDAVSWLDAHPDLELPAELKNNLLRSGDPEALITMRSFQENRKTNAAKESPDQIWTAERMIYSAGTDAPNVLSKLIMNGTVRSTETLSKMTAIVRANEDGHLLSERPYMEGSQRIERLGQVDPITKSQLVDNIAAQDAVLGYQREYLQWRVATPMATATEQQNMAASLEAKYTDMAKARGPMVKNGGHPYERGGIYTVPLTPDDEKRRQELLKKSQGK